MNSTHLLLLEPGPGDCAFVELDHRWGCYWTVMNKSTKEARTVMKSFFKKQLVNRLWPVHFQPTVRKKVKNITSRHGSTGQGNCFYTKTWDNMFSSTWMHCSFICPMGVLHTALGHMVQVCYRMGKTARLCRTMWHQFPPDARQSHRFHKSCGTLLHRPWLDNNQKCEGNTGLISSVRRDWATLLCLEDNSLNVKNNMLSWVCGPRLRQAAKITLAFSLTGQGSASHVIPLARWTSSWGSDIVYMCFKTFQWIKLIWCYVLLCIKTSVFYTWLHLVCVARKHLEAVLFFQSELN